MNATAEQPATVLVAPSQKNFYGGHKPHSPERRLVIDRVRRGEITRRQGAQMLGISYQWCNDLVTHYQQDEGTTAVSDPLQRQAVVERVVRGELSYRAAAHELNLAPLKVRQLATQHRAGLPDPTLVREHMAQRLSDPANQALTPSVRPRSSRSSATPRAIEASDVSADGEGPPRTANGASFVPPTTC